MKKVSEIALGLVVLAIVMSLGVTTTGGMPTNLRVAACPNTMQFYGPKCMDTCRRFGTCSQTTVSDAFKSGYQPSADCPPEYWKEYEVTALRELLDTTGVWQSHPWNRDGTWR